MSDESDTLACPHCWKNRKPCCRRTPHERCMNCNHRLPRGSSGAKSEIKFPGEDIDHQFQSCGWDQGSSLLRDCCDDLTILDLDIRSAAASPGPSASRVDITLHSRGSLTNNAVAMASLEAAIAEKFSSKLRSKVGSNDLISCSITAGSLLHVLCSARDVRGQIRTFNDGVPTAKDYSERNLTLDFRRVLASTVGRHVETIMNAIRSMNLGADQNSLCAYSAAALLHFEVDHFVRSMRNGDLSAEIPLGLEGPFVDWLKSIDLDLKNFVIEGCGEHSAWTSLIEGSRKSSRRQHEPLTIFLHLTQHKFDSPAPQTATPLTTNPNATVPLPDTGPASQFDSTYSSEPVFDMYGGFVDRARERLSQQESLPFTGYDPESHVVYKELDPLFYDPGIGDILGDPISGFNSANKEISDIQDPGTQPLIINLLTQPRVNGMTSNRQALHLSSVLQNRHPSSHTSALN